MTFCFFRAPYKYSYLLTDLPSYLLTNYGTVCLHTLGNLSLALAVYMIERYRLTVPCVPLIRALNRNPECEHIV